MSIYNLLESNNNLDIPSDVTFSNGITLSTTQDAVDPTVVATLSIHQTSTVTGAQVYDEEKTEAGTVDLQFDRLGNRVTVIMNNIQIAIDQEAGNIYHIFIASNTIPEGFRSNQSVNAGTLVWNDQDDNYYVSNIQINTSNAISFWFLNDEQLQTDVSYFPYNNAESASFTYYISNT